MAKALIEQLSKVPLFRGLSPDELATVAGCAKAASLKKGTLLIRHQAPARAAYVVVSGMFVAELPVPDAEAIEMAKMGAGSVIGEPCLVKDGPRALQVRCAEDAEVIALDRVLFNALRAKRHPGAYKIVRNICVTLCDRLRNTNEYIEREYKHEEHSMGSMIGSKGSLLNRAKGYVRTLMGRGDD